MTMAVAVVEYKYTPDQMPVEELKRTFAARQGLLDLVIRHLRAQAQAASLSSFLLIGPRGSGKTTLVLMLCQCIREAPELAAAWLPLRFREEQFEVCSLRDLLAAAVRGLADDSVPGAEAWSSRVEQATDDEESQALAVAALRDLAKSQGKRLILFVENLNLLMARAFDDTSQATLRRLLMVDPFLMLVGTAVKTFEEVEGYDKALFNYFHPLHLERLTDEQMCELLTRRAEYDGNTEFIERLGEHRPKLRALSRLTGGNPRFLLMVYEILSEGRLTSAVEVLRRLVDDLTPQLKHVLEDLPPQQAKILDALMRAGGTATPAGLAQSTRLKLNVVTAQLRRLKDNHMVEVLGGGKGQTAYYTIPNQLFCTWYQMRYLKNNRRRIELFVDVIRLWFEAEERWIYLRRLTDRAQDCHGGEADSLAESADYFAAALQGTSYDVGAKEIMMRLWAHAGAVNDVRDLTRWGFAVDEYRDTLADLLAGLSRKLASRDYDGVVTVCSEVIESAGTPRWSLAMHLANRAVARLCQNDRTGARLDLSKVLAMPDYCSPWDIMSIVRDWGDGLAMELVDESIALLDETPAPELVVFIEIACFAFLGPGNRASWARLVRNACERLPPDAVKRVGLLLPVADVLEGKDRSILDALPPEERALALEVLDAFEPKDDDSKNDAPNKSASETGGDSHAKA